MSYGRNYGLDVRIARLHNIFGPEGTWDGGKEKAPAAMCRKVIMADDIIEVWGDGLQTRSFLYIDECVEGLMRLWKSDCTEPVNIGSEEMISINDLARMAIQISGKDIGIRNVTSTALGVRGRNSDNRLIFERLGWKPDYSLRKGMEQTYKWIESQCKKSTQTVV
jgi:nucleoside-diphosphate-sugar epimerase